MLVSKHEWIVLESTNGKDNPKVFAQLFLFPVWPALLYVSVYFKG